MKINLWLDDLRDPKVFSPKFEWVWAKNYDEAIEYIYKNIVERISFDHDLGEEKTGYDLAKEIERLAHEKKINYIVWHIHSANMVGRDNIERAMISAERFWS